MDGAVQDQDKDRGVEGRCPEGVASGQAESVDQRGLVDRPAIFFASKDSYRISGGENLRLFLVSLLENTLAIP